MKKGLHGDGYRGGILKQAMGTTKADGENPMTFGDSTGAEEGMVRLFINIGRKQECASAISQGAVAERVRNAGKLVGCIDMYDKYTFVEVPKDRGQWMCSRDGSYCTKIKGKEINIERQITSKRKSGLVKKQ